MDQHIAGEIIERLGRDAERIAAAFGLQYQSVEADRPNVKRRYGICYSDGSIRIRLRHATSARALKYSSLINTLCHELAHLRHFNHGKRFRAFYLRLLQFARAEGIYRPRPPVRAPRPALAARPEPAPVRTHGPEQLDLFT